MVKSVNRPSGELLRENELLRTRLAESEQLIDALTKGEVDALVVAGATGRQVRPVGGADDVYRLLVEKMGEGAFTIDEGGIILYANQRLAEMLNSALEELVGSTLDEWLLPDDRGAVHALLAASNGGGARARGELNLLSRDRTRVPVYLSVSTVPLADCLAAFYLIATDLREQKRNEAIAAEERLARLILEQATDAIVVCDQSGRTIRASDAAKRMCREHLVGNAFEHCFPLQGQSGNALTLGMLRELSAGQKVETSLPHGEQRLHLMASIGDIGGADGEHLASIITLTDITDIKRAESDAVNARQELQRQLTDSNRARRALLSVVEDVKQAEEALRASEAHFRLALGILPISVWNMDRALCYRWVYAHDEGMDPAAMIGKTDVDLYGEEHGRRLTRIKRRVLETGESERQELSIGSEQRQQFCELFVEPLRDEDQAIVGLAGAMVDITNVRELKQAQERLSNALQQSGSPTAMLDGAFNFEFTNSAFEDLFGFARGELLGKPVSIIAPPDSTDRPVQSEILEIVQHGEVFRGELQRKHKDGELIPVYLTAAPLADEDSKVTGYVGSYNDLRALKESETKIKDALTGTITAITHTIEKRDPYTAGHQQRVAALATAIARDMGLDENRIVGLYLGSLIHDIGKIYIPAEILNRPGKLSAHEFGLIKSHPEVGHEIIKDVKFDWPIADMVYQHHERIDGSGYPQGLKGNEICLEAKIIAIADIVEAMTSHRPYRPGLGLDTALQQIASDAGKTLDADIVLRCLRVFDEEGFSWDDPY